MKIGFDGKRTTQNLTGLGNYGRYIVRILAKFYPTNQYTIYALQSPSETLTIDRVEYKYPRKNTVKSYWRSYGIVNDLVKQKVDLFHGISNEIPYGLKKARIPSVVTIHDLIFLRYPEYYKFIDRLIYKFKFRYAALNANKVIAISQQTKRDLVEYFKVREDRIEVIYQNCDPIFRQTVPKDIRFTIIKKQSLPEKYLLSVGTIEERKNLMLIVKALTKINNVHLVVVGKETEYTEKVKDFINENKLFDRVHFFSNIPHNELPAIYQQAELFIYPSKFEGFGIPIIEALHSGVPVIAATGSCLEEAGGPGSIYVDPNDHTDLANQIQGVLDNREKKDKMISSGRLYLEKFDDKKVADQLLQLYQNVLHDAQR